MFLQKIVFLVSLIFVLLTLGSIAPNRIWLQDINSALLFWHFLPHLFFFLFWLASKRLLRSLIHLLCITFVMLQTALPFWKSRGSEFERVPKIVHTLSVALLNMKGVSHESEEPCALNSYEEVDVVVRLFESPSSYCEEFLKKFPYFVTTTSSKVRVTEYYSRHKTSASQEGIVGDDISGASQVRVFLGDTSVPFLALFGDDGMSSESYYQKYLLHRRIASHFRQHLKVSSAVIVGGFGVPPSVRAMKLYGKVGFRDLQKEFGSFEFTWPMQGSPWPLLRLDTVLVKGLVGVEQFEFFSIPSEHKGVFARVRVGLGR